ncbi:MAG: hypothetical protein HYX87_05210 [Chloroflexi bacterium]|nr:hypothetical protein [Chloroflexota bacterium]
MDILLPEIALPIRLHECRANYRGHGGSFDTPLTGLGVRLDDGKAGNLEEGFPTTSSFSVSGQQMTAKIYAFKRGKAETYRKKEGIIFVVDGQTHGHLTSNFFSRKPVDMNRLEDSILVIVDCSKFSPGARGDLFMNSRDRLRNGEFRDAIEQELESIIRSQQGLRALREQRRREDIEARLQDSRPLKDVLESILKKSPSFAAMLAGLGPISNPFKSKDVQSADKPFVGKTHPTQFKFRKLDYGEELHRETPINMRSRVLFETDVANDYFGRKQYPGTFSLSLISPDMLKGSPIDYTLNLENGTATLNVKQPAGIPIGAIVKYQALVSDPVLVEPFVNNFSVKIGNPQEPRGGKTVHRRPPKPDQKGTDAEVPQGLALPDPVLVFQDGWNTSNKFDKYSALKVVSDPAEDDDDTDTYTYYVNMDNIYLKTELKSTKYSPEIVKARWQYGLVLIGLAMLRDDTQRQKDASVSGSSGEDSGNGEMTIYDRILQTTAALSPVLLPLVESLGSLSEDDLGVAVHAAN